MDHWPALKVSQTAGAEIVGTVNTTTNGDFISLYSIWESVTYLESPQNFPGSQDFQCLQQPGLETIDRTLHHASGGGGVGRNGWVIVMDEWSLLASRLCILATNPPTQSQPTLPTWMLQYDLKLLRHRRPPPPPSVPPVSECGAVVDPDLTKTCLLQASPSMLAAEEQSETPEP
ncbi:hypothetical protein G7046_g5094 [Stylonectria norvegica]|nr:hypothetical protein G7046_g5094 [Stylonectria norvegica]